MGIDRILLIHVNLEELVVIVTAEILEPVLHRSYQLHIEYQETSLKEFQEMTYELTLV